MQKYFSRFRGSVSSPNVLSTVSSRPVIYRRRSVHASIQRNAVPLIIAGSSSSSRISRCRRRVISAFCRPTHMTSFHANYARHSQLMPHHRRRSCGVQQSGPPQKFGCGGLLWFGPPRKFYWKKFNMDARSGFASLWNGLNRQGARLYCRLLQRSPDSVAGGEGNIIKNPSLRASIFRPSNFAISVDSHSVVDGLAPCAHYLLLARRLFLRLLVMQRQLNE